jgi:hypothetical protein
LLEGCKLEYRFACVLGQLDQNLESNFNIDDSAKNLKKLAYALGCLKLY